MAARTPTLPFDPAEAVKYLAARDDCLKSLIDETPPFRLELEETRSPYEALLQAIAYQSISGKAAATIFERVKTLGGNGRAPTPEKMLKLRAPVLRKAGLSGAKVLAMKDLARKTLAGVVPTLEQARRMSDEELVERLVSVRGIGVWSVTYGKNRMPKPTELLAFGERWRPYRTVASWYMWRAFERAGYAATNKIRRAKARRKRTQL